MREPETIIQILLSTASIAIGISFILLLILNVSGISPHISESSPLFKYFVLFFGPVSVLLFIAFFRFYILRRTKQERTNIFSLDVEMDSVKESGTKKDNSDNPPPYSEVTVEEEPPPSYQVLSKDPLWVERNNPLFNNNSPNLTEEENKNQDETTLRKMKWELTTKGIMLPIIKYKNDVA